MKKYSQDDQATLATWSLACAERVLGTFEEQVPDDERPRRALEVGREWVQTRVFHMSVIRGASLTAHAAARDIQSVPEAAFAARACGQAVATAHVPQHAYGGAYYALKALAAANPANAEPVVREELAWQAQQLPEYLRDEVMGRLIVQDRRGRLFISVQKGPDF